MNTPNPTDSAPETIAWWYSSKQQKFGPYTETQLHELARAGEFQADDLVWNNTLDSWITASSIGSLVFGAPVAQSAITEHAESPAFDEFEDDDAPTQEDIEQTQLMHFVGINHGFYMHTWARNENGFSWNWAAFFLGLFWLAYRKMYWACAVLIGIATLVIGTALQLKIPIETVQQWQPYFVISFSVALGLFGNRLYLLHAKHKIRQITTQYAPKDALREIEKQGGGSMASVLHVLTAVLLCSMVLGALFGQ